MTVVSDRTETQRLQNLSKYEILDSPPEPAFDDLTALAADICDVPMSVLAFLDGNREWFKSNHGLPVAELPRHFAFCDQTLEENDLLVVPDVTRDQRFANNPLVKGDAHIRFYAGYPLVSQEGYGLGALCVLDNVPHDLTERQKQLLRTLGHEARMLLEWRREARAQRRHNGQQSAELKRLHEQLLREKAEHRKAEEHLLQRERQLADAQRLARLGSWEWDLHTGAITWSDELYRIFGVRPGEFPATYEAYLERVHPDDRARTDALIRATLDTKGSFVYEKRIIRSDGVTRTLFSTGEVILDDKHQPVRMVGCAQDITPRKEIEDKLEASISLLNSTLESTADGILAVGLEGQLLEYNQRFLDLWRLPPGVMEAYDDRTVLARVLEQLKEPQAFLDKVQSLYGHPEQDSFDSFEFKDGRIFERYSRPLRVGETITGRVWSFRDVTERCHAVEALRLSEQRYRGLVIATAQVVWMANAKGDTFEDSPSWRAFTGQTAEEMQGRGWMMAVHPEDRPQVGRLWPQAVAEATYYEMEQRIRRADGEWRNMIVRGVPIFDEKGQVREWVGFCIDITDRKRSEQAIAEERDFQNIIINSLPGLFYLVDEHGSLVRWNSSVELVTGYSADELKNMVVTDFVDERDRQRLMERFKIALETGQSDVEVMSVTKAGERIPYYATGKLVHLGGKPHIVGMGIDISERKQAEAEIKKLNQQLEDRVHQRTKQLNSINSELQAFSYTVSHDLKAPLRAISGFATALMEDCADQLDDEHKEYLQRIFSSSDRMMQLIEDLLKYSRLGRTSIYLRAVDLSELLGELITEFKFQFDAIGGKLSLAAGMPVVKADPTLLRQVFSNLLENAIVYHRQEVPLEVDITWKPKGRNVVLCIADNGIGIDPAHYDRIFQVFQRLHTNEEYPGTGIGLANAKRAIELQGGQIWVESEVGKGSRFCIQLQRAETPQQ